MCSIYKTLNWVEAITLVDVVISSSSTTTDAAHHRLQWRAATTNRPHLQWNTTTSRRIIGCLFHNLVGGTIRPACRITRWSSSGHGRTGSRRNRSLSMPASGLRRSSSDMVAKSLPRKGRRF
ncbi:hypothetical protein QJS04_geneDACA003585 [Acorus gramineus]|uniref:Secreted protein n=1 Tax=Acorus gramineus TaxID=55184 RepID=A0AAV9BND3_ACOGR|nr:hypothetical protein QJS04_geneDACA003585 [Acorus gramineus]